MRRIRRQQVARGVQRLTETGNIAVAENGPHAGKIAHFLRAPRHVLVRQIANRRLRRCASYGLHGGIVFGSPPPSALCPALCHALARLENFADIPPQAPLSLSNPANHAPATSWKIVLPPATPPTTP